MSTHVYFPYILVNSANIVERKENTTFFCQLFANFSSFDTLLAMVTLLSETKLSKNVEILKYETTNWHKSLNLFWR